MSFCKSQWRQDTANAAEVWRRSLSDVLSVFGRLVYLSFLRDPNSGRYKNYGLGQTFGEDEAHGAIGQSHRESFSEWLCFSLEQQKADLDLYLSSLNVDKQTTLETWARLAPFRNLVPTDAMEPERRLFLADLDALLALLCSQYGIAVGDGDE